MYDISQWERLGSALRRLLDTFPVSEEEAKVALCTLLADGRIPIRAKHDRQVMGSMRGPAGVTLDRDGVSIPYDLKPTDIDWENSRPLAAWVLKPNNPTRLYGLCLLEWVEISRPDVTNLFATLFGNRNAAPQPSESGPLSSGLSSDVPSPGAPESIAADAVRRRRGRRAVVLPQTIEAMRNDLGNGVITQAELANMTEERLAERYGVSRDTARQARNAVLQIR